MGIGNHGPRAPYRCGTIVLITPHGDRKPSSAPPSESPRPPLITPHGDRKPVPAAFTFATCPALITPHGDRKLPAGQSIPVDALLLITPHGDRKPAITARDGLVARTSLPSWGSETSARSSADTTKGPGEVIALSLPLMGIGNPSRSAQSAVASCAPHYPSWGSETAALPVKSGRSVGDSLPLMGIGNVQDLHHPYKLSRHSLPLMGIGNRSASASATARVSSSLPLMGIGNHRDAAGGDGGR